MMFYIGRYDPLQVEHVPEGKFLNTKIKYSVDLKVKAESCFFSILARFSDRDLVKSTFI